MPLFLMPRRLGTPLDDEISGTQAGISALNNTAIEVARTGGDTTGITSQINAQSVYLAGLLKQRDAIGPPQASPSMSYAPGYGNAPIPPPENAVGSFLDKTLSLVPTIIGATKGAQNTASSLASIAQYAFWGTLALAGAWIVTRKK